MHKLMKPTGVVWLIQLAISWTVGKHCIIVVHFIIWEQIEVFLINVYLYLPHICYQETNKCLKLKLNDYGFSKSCAVYKKLKTKLFI